MNLRDHVLACLEAEGYPLLNPEMLEYRPLIDPGNTATVQLKRPFTGIITCSPDLDNRRIRMEIAELSLQLANPSEAESELAFSIGSAVDLPRSRAALEAYDAGLMSRQQVLAQMGLSDERPESTGTSSPPSTDDPSLSSTEDSQGPNWRQINFSQ